MCQLGRGAALKYHSIFGHLKINRFCVFMVFINVLMLWLRLDLGSLLLAVMVATLPPAVVYLLHSALILYCLYLYYCDFVWYPTTAKLTSLIKRVHSKFVNKLLLATKFSYLIERRKFHTSIQIFKSIMSIHQSSPSYM